MKFLLKALVPLVPERYRVRFLAEFVSADGAIWCGCLQLLICLGVVIYRYVLFSHDRLFAGNANTMLAAAERGGETVVMTSGLFLAAEYMIQPLTLLLAYFAIEGGVRMTAGIVTGEVVPTLPLQLLAWAHAGVERKKREHDLGPLVEDLLQPGSGDFALTIASCRPKPWTAMTTIAYEERLYELVSESSAAPPRRWVYVLRKRPESKVVRGEIYRYRPDELLRKEEAAAVGSAQ